MQLHNKTAIVTGGGRGIGRAIALGFAREGADVAVLARSAAEIEAVAGGIQSLGRRAVAVACDVGQWPAVEAAVARVIEHWGRVDILVNNAGGAFVRSPLVESDPADWDRTIQVNLMGTYYLCRAVVPHMIASGGGKIINVGSGMGHSARAGNIAYNTSKAGVWMFTQCLATEVWQHGIEVNELIPGPVYTKLTADYFPAGSERHPIVDSERTKQPEDCVPLALMLAAHPPGGPTAQSFSLARRPL